MSRSWALAAGSALTIMVGCGGDSTDPDTTRPPAPTLGLSIGVDDSTVTVADTVYVGVVLADTKSLHGQPGVLINFVVARGGGSVYAGSALTDANGQVREIWTLGTVADSQTLEARAVDPVTGQPMLYAQLVLVPTPDTLATIQVDSTPVRIFVGDSVELGPRLQGAWDRYGNTIDTSLVWSLGPSWVWRNGHAISTQVLADTLRWAVGSMQGNVLARVAPRWFNTGRWQITFSCKYVAPPTVYATDHSYHGTLDTVLYSGGPLWYRYYDPAVSAAQTQWSIYDSTGTPISFLGYMNIERMWPDSLRWQVPGFGGYYGTATRLSDSLLVGGASSWCDNYFNAGRVSTELVLQQY